MSNHVFVVVYSPFDPFVEFLVSGWGLVYIDLEIKTSQSRALQTIQVKN